MSVLFKAGSEICKACTNTSTAKYRYSFSKAERFPKPKEEILTPKQEELQKKINYKKHDYYALPSTLNNRYTKFGYGNRTDFTGGAKKDKNENEKLSKSEAIQNKDNKFEIDKRHLHGPQYTMANGREKYGKVYIESAQFLDKSIPGPAVYDVLKKVNQDFGYDAPKVSFGGLDPETRLKKLAKIKEEEKRLKMEEKEKQKTDPTYNSKVTIQIRPSGKYVVSQIPNVNSLNFEKDKSKRTQFEANKNPGPSDYDKDNFSLNKSLMGKIFQSKYRSSEPITFGSRTESKNNKNDRIGPGSYMIPSDFGIYLSKDYNDPKYQIPIPEKKEEDPHPWRHGMKKIKKKTDEDNDNNYNDYNDNNDNNDYNQNNQEEPTPTPGYDDNKDKEEDKYKDQEEDLSGLIMLRDILMYDTNEINEIEEKDKNEKKDKVKEDETPNKEEDKESEVIMLRDILTYH